MAAIEPFVAAASDEDLDDLRDRLRRTRWPDEAAGAGWDYGVPLGWMKDLVAYWADEFDWRDQEARINAFPNYVAELDGVRVHFVRAEGAGGGGVPLLLLHGWPSSFVEYLGVVPLLTGRGYDVVVPSLPGYGYSGAPAERAFTSVRIAEVVARLMDALGYERFGVHAHDHGASVTARLAYRHPERIIGYHTTEPRIPGPAVAAGTPGLSEPEREFFAFAAAWEAIDGGYAAIQSTRPQTLAYGLHDSPAGLAAWILDKWQAWTAPPSGNLFDAFSRDELLANVTLYWLTGTTNSAARAYFENARHLDPLPAEATIDVPLGVALVATQGIERVPREYAARRYPDIRIWTELPRGGHFIAGEEPELLAAAIDAFFRALRAT